MTAHEILLEVATKHGLDIDALKSKNRLRKVVIARAEFIRRAYAERKMSDGQIGRMINLTTWTVHYHRNDDARTRKNARRCRRAKRSKYAQKN